MGSGSLAAMAVFEAGYRANMEVCIWFACSNIRYWPSLQQDDAVELVHQAILAGIFNDLGSGSNVDITIITKGKVDIKRNMYTPNERPFKHEYLFPKGTTSTYLPFHTFLI